jgi:NAD(P)H-flavin reductase
MTTRTDTTEGVLADPWRPRFLRVLRRTRESATVASLELGGDGDRALPAFEPGQFNMLYAFGVGEVAISVSGDATVTDRVCHTVRAVGPVSRSLVESRRGARIGVRGPFGTGWPLTAALGCDVLLLAGGIGLVPLRPALYHVLRHREAYGRVGLLYGARTPADLLFSREIDRWRRTPDLQVRVAVERASGGWAGDVGYVTQSLQKIRFDPAETTALICGPEVMIRSSALSLLDRGVPVERIYVSLERNMKCAIGFCGHCQFGGHFVCKDGPVYRYDRIRELMAVREF